MSSLFLNHFVVNVLWVWVHALLSFLVAWWCWSLYTYLKEDNPLFSPLVGLRLASIAAGYCFGGCIAILCFGPVEGYGVINMGAPLLDIWHAVPLLVVHSILGVACGIAGTYIGAALFWFVKCGRCSARPPSRASRTTSLL